jgi:hypothetical protein
MFHIRYAGRIIKRRGHGRAAGRHLGTACAAERRAGDMRQLIHNFIFCPG